MIHSFFNPPTFFNCRGKLVDLSTPKVMGILNITPDSFYDKSRMIGEASALEQAGKEIGLETELAKDLALHTIVGAAKLMEQSNNHPEELRNQVTSPNGTTQAALESFAEDQLRVIVQRAAQAARDRSIELSNA